MNPKPPVPTYGPGTPAFLDSREGLIPCVVKKVEGRLVTVHFKGEPHDHWSGLTKNVWVGRTETFHATWVVPRAGIRKNQRIGPYLWVEEKK